MVLPDPRGSGASSGRSLRYRGRLLQSLSGREFLANYADADTQEEFWVSGCRKDGMDALYATDVQVDDDAREEYWLTIRERPDMVDVSKFRAPGKYRK